MDKLHRDWPEVDMTQDPYHWPDPVYDLAYALELNATDEFDMRRAIESIEKVEVYSVTYGDRAWEPGRAGGTELELILIALLHEDSYLSSGDKRWLVVEAWNDMSGWAGQFRVTTKLVDTLSEAQDALSWNGHKKLYPED